MSQLLRCHLCKIENEKYFSEDDDEAFEDAREALSPRRVPGVTSSPKNSSPLKELKTSDCITSDKGKLHFLTIGYLTPPTHFIYIENLPVFKCESMFYQIGKPKRSTYSYCLTLGNLFIVTMEMKMNYHP